MGKRKKIWKNDSQNSYKKPIINKFSEKDMDDEIDAFHKKNDVIPLVQDDDLMESDADDDELPVLNYKDIDGDEDDENNESDDSENNIEDEEDMRNDHKLENWENVEKFMRVKVGGVDDEMDEEEDENDEQNMSSWGGKKYLHGADTVDFEIQSSDDEAAAMEEAEILRIQRERAKYLSMEDFGLNEDLMEQEHKVESTAMLDEDDPEFINEVIRKDLVSLSKEEQMDVVYSFAPELVVLLPSLNDILGKLETSINPLLNKIQGLEKKGRVNFVEVKKILYQVYCQTIVFYLLLKSEGLPVRNHPVIARLVELKGLLNRLHQVEKCLPPEIEGLLQGELCVSEDRNGLPPLNLDSGDNQLSHVPSETPESKPPQIGAPESMKTLKTVIDEGKKSRREKDQVGAASREMLQLRAAMEEKLKKDGISASSLKSRTRDKGTPFLSSNKLETVDDFGDDVEGSRPKLAGSSRPTTLFELVTSKPKNPFRKHVVSGDADVAPREDIGERRRKYELNILAKMGAVSRDGEIGEDDKPEGEIVKNGKYESLDIFSRDAVRPSMPETVDGKHHISRQKKEMSPDSDDKIVKNKNKKTPLADADIFSRADDLEPVEGKRQISQQMEKNRGLTRVRKKADKNPRKKYRGKHDKAVMRRKGQVRDVRKGKGSYGGEPTGINATISRSVRFKH